MRQRKRHLLRPGLQPSTWHEARARLAGTIATAQDYWATLCGIHLAPRFDMSWVGERWPGLGGKDRMVWEVNHDPRVLSCPYLIQTNDTLRRMLKAAGADEPDRVPPRSDEYEVFQQIGYQSQFILVQSRPIAINPYECQKCVDAKHKGRPSAWPAKDLDHEVVPWLDPSHVCSLACGTATFEALIAESQ